MSNRKKEENNHPLFIIVSMSFNSLHLGVGHAWVPTVFLDVATCLSSNKATLYRQLETRSCWFMSV